MGADVTFADLGAAGRGLADALTAYAADRHALVLGIVRGGMPAAFEVARRLDLPLDVLLLKALVTRCSRTSCFVRRASPGRWSSMRDAMR